MSKHYHFIGVGGVGMGTIALLLVSKGYKVSGSDLKSSYFTENLMKRGAQIFMGHDARYVGSADCVVYSSAVSQDNPELTWARDHQVPILKRAQVLAQLMDKEMGIAIAGAHGKTTTTSMIAHMLLKANLQPTIAIGGVISGESYNANVGSGKYFVAEVDESDGSFLYFNPFYSVITNIDFEHMDYYHNLENILKAYKDFIDKTHPEGCLFADGGDDRLKSLLHSSQKRYITYGFSSDNEISARDIICQGYSSRFRCFVKNKERGQVSLQIPGRHNILNALACVGVGIELSIDFDVIARSLADFSGVQRRFQLKADINDIMVVEDYGHHPNEIRQTILAAKTFGKRRIVVAFQPHRYTRTKFLMDEFVDALGLSDYLVLTDIYAASEPEIEGVSSQRLYEKLKNKTHLAIDYVKKEDVTNCLFENIKEGDLVIVLGAGDIGKVSDELAKKLKESYVKS